MTKNMNESINQKQFLNVIDRDLAEKLFQSELNMSALESEIVPLDQVLGRVLAVDVDERIETIYLKLPWTTSDDQNVENQVAIKIKTTTNIDELLTKCDYVSLHIPKQSNGESVIGKRELELMKDNAIIINTSRGGVINEDDLIWALDNGKIAGAALDVYENEPNPKKELLSHPKILCTPHIGAATNEAQDRIGQEIVDIIFEKFSLVSE